MTTFSTTIASKESDGALVAAAKHGDTLAFEELVRRHKRRVFATALRITNNHEDAEDVVQECFHKVSLHLAAFEERSQFSTWLTRIAMNEAFMLVRRRRGNPEVLPDHAEDGANTVSEAFVDQRPDPEQSCWKRERAQLLNKAINKLAPKIRTTIQLRDIEERSAVETAQILDTSVSAVKARVFHGRRKLRVTLNTGFLRRLCTADHLGSQRC